MKSSIQNSRIVGIDLGTTFTEVAYIDDTGKPKIIPNRDGDYKTPSVTYIGPACKEILVGAAAENLSAVEPKRVIREFKRDVGTDRVYFTEGGIPITPEWCQTQMLKYIRQSAIEHFGDDRAASQAVITVPAYFGEKERQSVKHSAEQAGIQLIGLINEPTAAGLAYGINEKQGDRLMIIVDFGGGTLDVTVIMFNGVAASVLSTHGDNRLGGKEIDEILLKMVQDPFRKEHGLEVTPQSHPADWFTIRADVIRQKHMLASKTEVKLCARVDGKQVVVPVTRHTLAQAIKPLLDRIEKITLEAIQNAKVNRAEIKHVLKIGGSSRLVAFEERIKQLFGAECLLSGQVSPDMAVAEGAAIHAAKLASAGGNTLVNAALQAIPMPCIKHTDVMPHSLGVGVQDRVSSATYCSVILERNRVLPCQAVKSYGSVDDRQTRFKISVLQGEEGQATADCLVVGEKDLELPARKTSEQSIEVTMGYDASGMVRVNVRDLISGRTEDITVDFYTKN